MNGIFEYEPEHVVIRPELLEMKGAPGALLHGKFFVEGAAGQRVHGYLYPSDARMICEPSEFHGITNEIHYQFDCSGLQVRQPSKTAASESGRQSEPAAAGESGRQANLTVTGGESVGQANSAATGGSGVQANSAATDESGVQAASVMAGGSGVQADSAAIGEPGVQADSAANGESGVQADSAAAGESARQINASTQAEACADNCIRGAISLCCDCGEFEIPYVVYPEMGQAAEELPFSTLEEFVQLARADYQRAYRYFLRSDFRTLLKGMPDILALYEGLRLPDVSYRSMEEFLVASGQKTALTILAGAADTPAPDSEPQQESETLELDYGELSEPVRETVRLRKNTWGFLAVSVESDALFVRPERKIFSTDDFAGSTFDLNLVLDTNLMHAGNNYARLTVKAGRQTIRVLVTARKKPQWTRDRQAHIQKIMTKKLENLYVDFRLQKTDMPTWIEHSVSVINSYKRAGGDDPFADLFLVQMYYADDRKHKASRLLEQVEAQKQRLDTPERYCFYLYITTFFYQEASYVDRVEEEVCKQFYRRQESWQLQWILLYLQEKYLNNPDARYEAVAEQFVSGCRSRILYVEAWQVLKENPFLLRHIGEFELHLLHFADQEKVLTAEILRQVANLSMHHTAFDVRLYQALANGWRLYPSDDLVRAICQILISGDRKETQYFEWYERGVKAGLRMNGLYEAYLQTMGAMEFRDLPQIIRMYFSYDTSLDFSRRAALYRSIYENREREPQTWVSMRASMERFVAEQLESGHITEDLAVLYSGFLRESMITPSLAGKLIKLLFTYEIVYDQNDMDIRQIVLHSVRMQQDYAVNLKKGRAQIRIYDPDAALFAVDAAGSRHEAHSLCRIRRLFEDERLLAWCSKKAPDYPGLVIFLCAQSIKSSLMNERLPPYFRAGCGLYEISDSFRDELRSCVLDYYLAHPRDESLPEFLDGVLEGSQARRGTSSSAGGASRRGASISLESAAGEDENAPTAGRTRRSSSISMELAAGEDENAPTVGRTRRSPSASLEAEAGEGAASSLQVRTRRGLSVLTGGASRRGSSALTGRTPRRDETVLAKSSARRNSMQDFASVNKTAMIILLAEDGRCAEAFALLDEFGSEDIPLIQLVRITSRMVLELEFEENTMLLSLCHQCFAKGKYDDKLLRYLLLYYEGPTEDMKQLWNAACEFGLDTMQLEEKILMMMLFTRTGTQGSEPIFEAYLKKMGRKKLCRAYVNLKSYEYFVKGLPVAEPVFSFIEKDYRRFSGTDRLSEQEQVCRFALLDYYARAASLTKTQRVYAAELLEEFQTKGMRFAFFKRFDEELLRPWQLQGHVFAEYAGDPKSTVHILYRYKTEDTPGADEADYIREAVPNCFEGIFVKEFILFADEEIECFFEEEPGADAHGAHQGSMKKETWTIRSGKRTLRPDQDDPDSGMYGLLNHLCRAEKEGNEEEARETLDTWLTLEYLAKEIFTLV